MTREAELADLVLEMVGDRAEAQVRVTGGDASLTRFANSYIHQNVGEDQLAIDLKLVVGGRVSQAATTNVDEDSLADLVNRTIESAHHQPVDHEWPGLAPRQDTADVDHFDEATAAAPPADRAAIVAEFVAAGPGMRAAGYCDTDGGAVAFANSAGHRAQGRATRATIDGIHQTDSSAGSGHQTAARLADLSGAATGALAAERARRGADPYDVKPGEYEVVLAPEAVATMTIFLAFYGFNAKSHREGQSYVELGSQQLDRNVSIWDDATAPEALGVSIDADGTPKRRVEFVTDGVSVSLAHDRRTANLAGAESTAHAIPGGESFGAVPTNLVFGSGDATEEELIAAVDRGIYVATFNYCRILDPKTQVVTGLTRNGTFMIENGEITGALTNMRFTQSFVEALGPDRVLDLGNNGRFADCEFGAGLVRAPSARLAGFHFTGGADG